MNKKKMCIIMFALFFLTLTSLMHSAVRKASASETDSQKNWDQIVDAAKKEGTVIEAQWRIT